MIEKIPLDRSTLDPLITTTLPPGTDPKRHRQGQGKAGRSGPPGNGNARTHGLHSLKRAVRTLGSRTIDRRTKVGRALAAWCEDLGRDLGGVDAISTAQKAIIDQAATTRLLLDSIDGWLITQRSLVDKRKRALLPVVRERQALADALVRYLSALGLERQARPVETLESYLARIEARDAKHPPAGNDGA